MISCTLAKRGRQAGRLSYKNADTSRKCTAHHAKIQARP